MNSEDDFQSDGLDELLRSALRARPEVAPTFDLAVRAMQLAREQEQAQLQAALAKRLRVWNRHAIWNWAATAAAVIVLGIGWLILRSNSAQLSREYLANAGRSAQLSTSVEQSEASTFSDGTDANGLDDATADTTTDTLTSETIASASATSEVFKPSSLFTVELSDNGRMLGVAALLGSLAVLTIARCFSRGDQQYTFAATHWA